MYELVLILHSWLRWVAILGGIAATAAAFTARAEAPGKSRADTWGLAFMIALDLQLLLGLLLYLGLSPLTAAAFEDFGAAMRNPGARFWAVEHISLMMFAVVMAHVGRVLGRKARTPGAKRLRLLVCFALATAALLAGTPWPGTPNGRPLFPL